MVKECEICVTPMVVKRNPSKIIKVKFPNDFLPFDLIDFDVLDKQNSAQFFWK